MFEGCFDPDWSSAKAGAKAQVVPDHAAALCPSKYPSCSTKGRGECPCAGWAAWTEGTWQLSELGWWRPLFVHWSEESLKHTNPSINHHAFINLFGFSQFKIPVVIWPQRSVICCGHQLAHFCAVL